MAQWTTTYTSLIDLLGDYVEDNSTEFTSAVLGCVNRAEERVIRDIDLVLFNATASGTTANATATYAKGFTGSVALSVYLSDDNSYAERRSLAYVNSHGGTGVPRYFYENETQIKFAPTPDGTYSYSIEYLDRPTPLSVSNQTNWLTQNVADLLLLASLVECEGFLIAPERVQEFEQKYQQMLGPVRAFWRQQMQLTYEPINPTPAPQLTR